MFRFSKLKTSFVLLLCFAMSFGIAAQTPRGSETTLLNGLRLVTIKNREKSNLTVRIRIHTGSAFDVAGKEGTKRMLAEALFPNDEVRGFFKEEYGDPLLINVDYDHVEYSISVQSQQLLSLLENLAPQFINPTLDVATTDLVRKRILGEIESIQEEAHLTQLVAEAFLGTFPYGRPISGTRESLARIDFADLVQARTRFLTSDNSTIVIEGNIDEGFVARATRRLFGPWLKADQKARATFAAPNIAATDMKEIAVRFESKSRFRSAYAVRSFRRSDSDFPAFMVLKTILEERVAGLKPVVTMADRGHAVQGVLLFLIEESGTTDSVELFDKLLADVTSDELAKSKTALQLTLKDEISGWFDRDTYSLPSPTFYLNTLETMTKEDVQRALDKLKSNPRGSFKFSYSRTAEGNPR